MKEKPIIFSTPEVRAIQEGRKTMTRRMIKPQPEIDTRYETAVIEDGKLKIYARGIGDLWETRRIYKMPYHVGDILWVRETWRCNSVGKAGNTEMATIEYKVGIGRNIHDITPVQALYFGSKANWRPSIHMPRACARIFLEVKSVRVERLQDISQEDARAEGVKPYHYGVGGTSYKNAFLDVWNSLNAKSDYSWDSNPWVWVIEFERVEQA